MSKGYKEALRVVSISNIPVASTLASWGLFVADKVDPDEEPENSNSSSMKTAFSTLIAEAIKNNEAIEENRKAINENRIAIEAIEDEIERIQLGQRKIELENEETKLMLEKSELEDIQNKMRAINTLLTEYNNAALEIKDMVNASDDQLDDMEDKIKILSSKFPDLIEELDDSNVPEIPLRELIPNIMAIHAEILSELSLYPTVDNIIQTANTSLAGYKRAYRLTNSADWIEIENLWNQAIIKQRARYVVKVKTGASASAGTDGNINFRFITQTSELMKFDVRKAGRNNPFRISPHTNLFERGHTDIFAFTGNDILSDHPEKVEIKLRRGSGIGGFFSTATIDWVFEHLELHVLRVDSSSGSKEYSKLQFSTNPAHKRTFERDDKVIFPLTLN